MLPQVSAATTVQPLSLTATGQRDSQINTGTSAQQAPSTQAPQTTPDNTSDGIDAVTQTLKRLADLLGSKNVDAQDVLTRLAIEFADLIGEQQIDGESPADFANRLADTILKLPIPVRTAAEMASGFQAMGITAQDFVAALQDPASPEAAHIVAVTEDPEAEAAKQLLKTAISTYEQNNVLQPATLAAQRTAAQGSAATNRAPAQSSQPGAAHKPAEGEASADASDGHGLASGHATAAPQATTARSATTPGRADVQPQPLAGREAAAGRAEEHIPQAETTDRKPDQGEHTMQVLRGFNVVISNVAAKAAEALKTLAMPLPEQAPSETETNGRAATKSAMQKTVALLPNEGENTQGEQIAAKAHQAARAMEGKVVQLFARAAATGEDVDASDIERVIKLASQATPDAGRTDAARQADTPPTMMKLPDGTIAFVQVPLPFARDEDEVADRHSDERGFNDNEGDESAANQNAAGDGEDEAQKDADAYAPEERPFDAEEPLKRNPTDAERAFHLYQRFGGF